MQSGYICQHQNLERYKGYLLPSLANCEQLQYKEWTPLSNLYSALHGAKEDCDS